MLSSYQFISKAIREKGNHRVTIQNILDVVPMAIIVIDENSNLILSNSKANAWIKTCRNSYKGKCDIKCTNRQRCTKSFKVEGKTYFSENNEPLLGLMSLEEESSERFIEWNVDCQLEEHGFTIVYGQDVTERQLSLKKALVALKEKQDFMAKASHDFKTPLSIISQTVQLKLKQNPPQEQREYLDTIASCVNDLHKLVTQEIEDGIKLGRSVTLSNSRFFAESLVNLTLYKLQCSNKKLEFELINNIPPETPLMGSFSKIRAICTNLVSNAIKYTDKGSVIVKMDIEEKTDKAAIFKFAVKDTGVGIEEKNYNKIFQLYHKSDRPDSSGVGLNRAKEYADLMDGDISFTSRLGKGSEFTFKAELGLYKPLGVEETKKIFGDRHPRPRVNGKTVLVAEDQPLMRKLVKRTLDGYGVNALMAEDGLQAVEIVKSKAASIDLIIMDLDMPNLNGLDATKEIRDMGHDMGIVCFSANPSDKIKKKCLEVGFSDFIPKLISPQSFNRILKPLEDIPSET